MSKELVALKPSVILKFVDGLLKRYEGKTDYNIYITKEWLLEINQALQRLEQIDNANPSEALECLERVNVHLETKLDRSIWNEQHNTIKQALLKAQEQDEVPEVIKEKKVDFSYLEKCDSVVEYNLYISNYDNNYWKKQPLTQDEFNLLKEVLV